MIVWKRYEKGSRKRKKGNQRQEENRKSRERIERKILEKERKQGIERIQEEQKKCKKPPQSLKIVFLDITNKNFHFLDLVW